MNEFEAVAAFAVAAVVTLVTTPLTGRLAVRVGAIDLPRDRDLHDEPVPSLGGLAILAGVLVSAVIFLPIDATFMPYSSSMWRSLVISLLVSFITFLTPSPTSTKRRL